MRGGGQSAGGGAECGGGRVRGGILDNLDKSDITLLQICGKNYT